MKIEMNTAYLLSTLEHEIDFLKQADKQGIIWRGTRTQASLNQYWNSEKYCILSEEDGLSQGGKTFIENWFPEYPIIEWQIGFTKTDMQIGQAYKMRNGVKLDWEKSDIDYYTDDLKHKFYYDFDIIEVYPLNITPIWKREEPKKISC